MLVALISGLPAIIAALAAISVRREVHTNSGTHLSEIVTASHEKAVENNAILHELTGD